MSLDCDYDRLEDMANHHSLVRQITGLPVVARTDISVSDWGVKIDNAKVVKTDVSATNGVIHVIDHVILPQS